ncbi:MAG: hypothetical protein ABFS23_03710 [Pseudomonadota bacterium]
MSDNSITLTALHYDTIGVVHCGVTREGFVTCAGDVANIDDGGEVAFERPGIVAKRNGSDYTFSKV